jgi:protein-L-isoaspartate O-methyltransferase
MSQDWRIVVVAALCASGAATLSAQAPAASSQPKLGQQGKDVVWIPSPAPTVTKMLDLARVTANDHVIDLGSGDGVTVIAAARRGATAMGVEFDKGLVDVSRQNAAAAGVSDRVTFVEGDFFKTDLSKATVVTLFVHVSINMKLRPMLLDLRPGTRIVSNTFDMGDWRADQVAQVTETCTRFCTALLWVVPAHVDGVWRLDDSELRLTQQFQNVTGTLTTGGVAKPISAGRLNGDEISFFVGSVPYKGRVKGGLMEGTVAAGGTPAWRATRATPPNRAGGQSTR